MYTSIIKAIEYHTEVEFTRGVIIGMAYALKRTVTYAEVATALGKNRRGLGPLLGDLIAFDVAAERAITSALVVNAKTGMPGEGFMVALAAGFPVLQNQKFSDKDLETLWRAHVASFSFVVLPPPVHS
jgi:hypothetical protein